MKSDHSLLGQKTKYWVVLSIFALTGCTTVQNAVMSSALNAGSSKQKVGFAITHSFTKGFNYDGQFKVTDIRIIPKDLQSSAVLQKTYESKIDLQVPSWDNIELRQVKTKVFKPNEEYMNKAEDEIKYKVVPKSTDKPIDATVIDTLKTSNRHADGSPDDTIKTTDPVGAAVDQTPTRTSSSTASKREPKRAPKQTSVSKKPNQKTKSKAKKSIPVNKSLLPTHINSQADALQLWQQAIQPLVQKFVMPSLTSMYNPIPSDWLNHEILFAHINAPTDHVLSSKFPSSLLDRKYEPILNHFIQSVNYEFDGGYDPKKTRLEGHQTLNYRGNNIGFHFKSGGVYDWTDKKLYIESNDLYSFYMAFMSRAYLDIPFSNNYMLVTDVQKNFDKLDASLRKNKIDNSLTREKAKVKFNNAILGVYAELDENDFALVPQTKEDRRFGAAQKYRLVLEDQKLNRVMRRFSDELALGDNQTQATEENTNKALSRLQSEVTIKDIPWNKTDVLSPDSVSSANSDVWGRDSVELARTQFADSQAKVIVDFYVQNALLKGVAIELPIKAKEVETVFNIDIRFTNQGKPKLQISTDNKQLINLDDFGKF